MSVSNKQEKKKKIIIDLESSEESFQKIRKHIKTEAAEDTGHNNRSSKQFDSPGSEEEQKPNTKTRLRNNKKQKDSKHRDKISSHKKPIIFGSLEAGDDIDKIEFYKINEEDDEKVFKIYWRKRQDGIQPKVSFMEYEMLKYQAPFKLIKFWETLWVQANKWIKDQSKSRIHKTSQPQDKTPLNIIENQNAENQQASHFDVNLPSSNIKQPPNNNLLSILLQEDLQKQFAAINEGQSQLFDGLSIERIEGQLISHQEELFQKQLIIQDTCDHQEESPLEKEIFVQDQEAQMQEFLILKNSVSRQENPIENKSVSIPEDFLKRESNPREEGILEQQSATQCDDHHSLQFAETHDSLVQQHMSSQKESILLENDLFQQVYFEEVFLQEQPISIRKGIQEPLQLGANQLNCEITFEDRTEKQDDQLFAKIQNQSTKISELSVIQPDLLQDPFPVQLETSSKPIPFFPPPDAITEQLVAPNFSDEKPFLVEQAPSMQTENANALPFEMVNQLQMKLLQPIAKSPSKEPGNQKVKKVESNKIQKADQCQIKSVQFKIIESNVPQEDEYMLKHLDVIVNIQPEIVQEEQQTFQSLEITTESHKEQRELQFETDQQLNEQNQIQMPSDKEATADIFELTMQNVQPAEGEIANICHEEQQQLFQEEERENIVREVINQIEGLQEQFLETHIQAEKGEQNGIIGEEADSNKYQDISRQQEEIGLSGYGSDNLNSSQNERQLAALFGQSQTSQKQAMEEEKLVQSVNIATIKSEELKRKVDDQVKHEFGREIRQPVRVVPPLSTQQQKPKPNLSLFNMLGIDLSAEKRPVRKQVQDDLEDLCLRIREKVIQSKSSKQ